VTLTINSSSQAHLSKQDINGKTTMMDELFDNKKPANVDASYGPYCSMAPKSFCWSTQWKLIAQFLGRRSRWKKIETII
jgi:hypothetical protein